VAVYFISNNNNSSILASAKRVPTHTHINTYINTRLNLLKGHKSSLAFTSSSRILHNIRGGSTVTASSLTDTDTGAPGNFTEPSHTYIPPSTTQFQSHTTPVNTNNANIHASNNINSNDEYKKALIKTLVTVTSATAFGLTIAATQGKQRCYEFFAGYLIEQSLSIDNLFVFVMLFEYFDIPMHLQNRVLGWGIGGAVVLRGLMIGVGVAALQKFRHVILVFAGILVASSVNLLMESHHELNSAGNAGENEEVGENVIMKITKFVFRENASSELHGEDFFVKDPVSGRNMVTPLFLCLVCVELSDFVFAVDSIPAVLGVSKDPLIVYASNIFAILALRSLYTVVAEAVSSFRYLKPAVAAVLGFVGVKMVAEFFHYHVGTDVSLLVICGMLGSGIAASVLDKQKHTREL